MIKPANREYGTTYCYASSACAQAGFASKPSEVDASLNLRVVQGDSVHIKRDYISCDPNAEKRQDTTV
jgi:hypothetical protein